MNKPLERLQEFIRRVAPGKCRVLSLKGKCTCPLCDAERLALDASELTAERDRLRALLVRAYAVTHRFGWDEGETNEEIAADILVEASTEGWNKELWKNE